MPLFVSALGAIAGITEVGLLVFADCDGSRRRHASSPAATSSRERPRVKRLRKRKPCRYRFTGRLRLQLEVFHHVTISTAPSIQTVVDLRGAWASGGVAGPFISVTGNSISIDMSALHRPTASGSVLNSTQISVKFPDDKTYTGVLQAPNVIKWSNNSSWTKVPAIQTVIDLNGQWMSGGVLGPVITVHGNSISIDMSALKRPTAVGTVVNSSDISVKFPDDKTYSGVLQKPGTIRWSNNSTWTKFETSDIKHLFVLMMENRSFDHLLGFPRITGKDAQTGLSTSAEGLTNTESNVYEFQTFPVTKSATDRMQSGPNHQFNDVIIQPLRAQFDNKQLNGEPYPAVNGTGYAAAYGITTRQDAGRRGDAPASRRTNFRSSMRSPRSSFSAITGSARWPVRLSPNRMFVHAATSGAGTTRPTGWQQTKDELGGTVSASQPARSTTACAKPKSRSGSMPATFSRMSGFCTA